MVLVESPSAGQSKMKEVGSVSESKLRGVGDGQREKRTRELGAWSGLSSGCRTVGGTRERGAWSGLSSGCRPSGGRHRRVPGHSEQASLVSGVVTERDLAMVRWLGRFPFLTIELLHRWMREVADGGEAVSIVYARLRVLDSAGLVESARVLATAGRAVWLSPEGIRAAEASGRSRAPRVSTFHHDALVAHLATDLVVDKPTHTLITEREIRGFETPNKHGSQPTLYTTPRPEAQSPQARQYPDLVTVAPSGAHVVHEVENSVKETRRLARLMLAHLANEAIGGVRYYAAAGPVLTRVESAASMARELSKERGLSKPLTVVRIEDAAP